MKEILKSILKKLPLLDFARRMVRVFQEDRVNRCFMFMNFPPFDADLQDTFNRSGDPVRYAAIALAINTIKNTRVDGSLAEVGVYKGHTSRIIHMLAPERTLYLFDTFEGFPPEDLEYDDNRFEDTNIEAVHKTIGNLNNVLVRKGYFPETAQGLEDEEFAFVMVDVDKYKSTLAALEFFYPRTKSGGYVFVHDYNSPESGCAVSRAVSEFMGDKPEKFVEIPDLWGSIVIRKM